ncbi:unnamed protein product [Trichogramma brassicae]|uniref:Uncharacterized protein n=1 Tax=Trichogramma brassicae TaxID=86971 RepID=A0A6H5IHV1_9HYME|nr:unnamed protein product [Trichogramma brassicae]
MKLIIWACIVVIHWFPTQIDAHGRLMEPVNRGSAWRKQFPVPENYDDTGNNCGGYDRQHGYNRGHCGVCGDDFSLPRPRPNENGGEYGLGVIERYKTREVDRTTFITFERVCGLVPMISKPTLRLSSSIQWTLLLMLSLVAIVWLSSLLLLRRNGGDGTSSLLSYWRPLDIGLIMMGASIPAQAVTLRERIVFGCVLVVGLFYSSSILAHLTSLNLDLKAHKKFETYRDLEESGLIPFINPYTFNMTFRESNDLTLHRLGNRTYQSPDVDMCLGWLLDHANVSCIFGEKFNLCLLELYNDRMKQAEPCFWSSYRVIIMRQGSPYTLSFNRIIRVVQESGIVSKWWQNFHENAVNSHKNHKQISVRSSPWFIETKKRRHRLKNNSDWRVFFLLLAGYVLSLTVFSMELIFKLLYTKLQRQCLLFPSKLDNLHGYRLRVGFYNDPPFSWRSHESLKIDGFVSVLLEMLKLQLNFSVELDFVMNYPLLNNTYSSLLVQIVSNRRLDVFAAGAFLVHVQEPFQLFWQEQLIDVTIIDISSKVSKHRRKIATVNHETDYVATIHYYDPFTETYTNRPLDSSNKLFPAKLDDLYGHRLRVGFVENPPYSLGIRKSEDHMGIYDSILGLIQSKLNFSVEPDFLMEYPLLNDSYTGLLLEVI